VTNRRASRAAIPGGTVRALLWRIYQPFSGFVAWLAKLGWRLGGRPWEAYERQGILPIPLHYYQPYPAARELDQSGFWGAESRLAGIDLRIPECLTLLEEMGREFGDECDWPETTDDVHAYHCSNGTFGFSSAAVAHAMVRRFKPRRIVEVGSGYSTHILCDALDRNAVETGSSPELTSIEPYPPEILNARLPRLTTRVERRVEQVDPSLFGRLQGNDILFIDSSHVIRYGGDVLFLYLEILPELNPGVVVHIHDIHLPDPYPRAYFEDNRYIWNEQQLLHAYLCHNDRVRVLMPCWLIHKKHDEAFQAAFPRYRPALHRPGSSFWLQRNP
jgi:predicted O-methyltransferase YrrM